MNLENIVNLIIAFDANLSGGFDDDARSDLSTFAGAEEAFYDWLDVDGCWYFKSLNDAEDRRYEIIKRLVEEVRDREAIERHEAMTMIGAR